MELAVLGINHLNKKTDMSAIHRVSGARAWLSVARLNFLVGKSESGTRHLCPLKMNLGPDGEGSLDFSIDTVKLPGPGIQIGAQPVIVWHGQGRTTAEGLVAPKTPTQVNEAVIWLGQALMPIGEWHQREKILVAGVEAGFSEDRLDRARRKLGNVETRRTNTSPSRTEWRLAPPLKQPMTLEGQSPQP